MCGEKNILVNPDLKMSSLVFIKSSLLILNLNLCDLTVSEKEVLKLLPKMVVLSVSPLASSVVALYI